MIRKSLIPALVVCGALLAGCAGEQPPITRVQPNYFDKQFFIGADYKSVSDDPEFYSQGTLVDVGYGAGQDGLFTSTYAQPLTRVKWTVQEDLLVARLSYERVSNSDGKGAGGQTNDGIVVAAYRISSHFDIRRQYNPSTGEQTNVIEENSVDRPWYERQYIRVDWTRNLSTDNFDYDTLSQLGVFGGVVYEPLGYVVNDPTHPDAPHFDPANGYLDVTNKAFAKPQMVAIPEAWGGGSMPACYFDPDFSGGVAPATGCNPVELTIRQSFRKVEDTDYEPQDWDGYRFMAFGAFTTERYGYARTYGMTDTQWHRFINRYNIWKVSHQYSDPATLSGEVACFTPKTTPAGADPHRDENLDGTEDECAAVGQGSRCDTFKQRCTLPYRQREVRPVVWYYANGSHPEFFDPTRQAANEWDVAIRSAVITARYAECERTGFPNCRTDYPVMVDGQPENDDAVSLAREVDDCRAGIAYAGEDCNGLADRLAADRGYSAAVLAIAKMPEALVLCHSPVEANDPSACGSPRLPANVTAAQCHEASRTNDTAALATCSTALNVRRGDLRYHQVNAMVPPATPSPWGIMVDSNDPLTGEVVAASINVWTHVNDLWSQGVVDLARYIKGEISTSDITEGLYVRELAQAFEAASNKGSLPKVSENGRFEMVSQMLGKDAAEIARNLEGFKKTPVYADVKKLSKELRQVRADARAPSTTAPIYEARRKKALGSATEAALTTKMMQSFSGGAGKISSELMSQFASPLRGANPAHARQLRNAKELALADRSACMLGEAPAPLAATDIANVLEAKFGKFDKTQAKGEQLARAEKMRKYLAQRAHYAVISHEMGHSMGLRHNFVSSSDAFNYRPQYWQLRTDNGANTTKCTAVDSTGSCVGPRYQDPVNENERKNLITMFMSSSTMDYAGEAAQDLLGLGAYDFAAARMFYGETAAVLADPTFKAGQPKGIGVLEKLDNFGGLVGISYSLGTPTPRDPTASEPFHYSQLQANYGMISDCKEVDVVKFKPATWNDETMGSWSPLIDGQIVTVGGKASRCKGIKVDYVSWTALRNPVAGSDVGFPRGGSAIDRTGRVRFPYGFATDRWADLGNLAVYRHDNGADPYELFDFLITQQEVNHVFDNYRRGRQTFSVRGAATRSLSRYTEKLRDAAKGMGLIANIYRDFALSVGYDYDGLWPVIAAEQYPDNILASGLGFDHIAKQLARPEAGNHFVEALNGVNVLRSSLDTPGNPGVTAVTVPNGATGYFGNVGFGGRPVENALAENRGEYDAEFTVNAGSYYEKAYTAMLMTESVDNFISDSRRDFVDGRYRAVSIADVFPDGYRRWLANNLTNDDLVRGSRLATDASGNVLKDTQGYPQLGLGHVRWWKPTPEVCFQRAETLECGSAPSQSIVVDPQVGWEQQKFLIAYTLMYLPENQQQTWLNQLNIWEIGADTDPGFANRIELHLPNGKVYVAKTSGKETIMGKRVQRGISARILEWANELLAKGYDTTPGPDLDGDGSPDWVKPVFTAGKARVKFDPTIKWINEAGQVVNSRPGCSATDNSQCTCTSNKSCVELEKYEEMPFFVRQAMRDYGLADPSMRGIY